MSQKIKTALTYDDVLLVPQYSNIHSRNEISLKSKLDEDLILNSPIISAPMDTVSEAEMAIEMSRLGGLCIIHRYNSIEEQLEILKDAKRGGAKIVGCAVGANGDFIDRATQLRIAGADFICVDIAHGHHDHMRNAIRSLKEDANIKHVMAGNVATADGFADLQRWGADSIKVGIGNGSICSTRIQTGHGVPSITAIQECLAVKTTAKLIADGGIRNGGDIVKALAAGADFVMLGSLLAGTKEAPGELITTPSGNRKAYRGMASREAQNDWRGKSSAPEGISITIPYKGELEPLFIDMLGHIRSGLSYTGARNIKELQDKAEFLIQTSAGQFESSTHIVSRA
jgi:IMP dehydrogenase